MYQNESSIWTFFDPFDVSLWFILFFSAVLVGLTTVFFEQPLTRRKSKVIQFFINFR
jgi:hypothetical protein